jgi:hypothetical protein
MVKWTTPVVVLAPYAMPKGMSTGPAAFAGAAASPIAKMAAAAAAAIFMRVLRIWLPFLERA